MTEAERTENPRLRAVEAIPVRVDGEDLVCLKDPHGIAERPIFLNRFLVFLVSRMDGTRSLRDLQADVFRATGEILPMEQLESLVSQLEATHYLDSPSFRSYFEDSVRRFLGSPVRPARHAGAAYEEDEAALRSQIAGFFTHEDGPGEISAPDPSRPLRGLVSPHIDFHRGGPTYAHAYGALAGRPGADRFIIFGTCHTPMQKRFALTEKDYETPLGPARTDREFVERLASRLEEDYLADEYSHRGEHSIEFQAVCLQYVLGGKQDFRIIPILVGSFSDILMRGAKAAEDGEIQAMVEAIRRTMEEMPSRYCVIAGADLAHVGRRFGDPSGPTKDSLRAVETEDLRFLRLVEEGHAEAVFDSIAADGDRRRVCGYPPIYMTLRCLGNPRGKLIQYRQWSDLEEGAAVTYAGVAID